jgi:hypothetical protein
LDAFQVIDAFSAAFFGLLGIWAAVVERHWFLRVSVVSLFLLAALLIPAYEVLVEFGVQIATIALALRLYRHGLRGPRKFSMATALLAMLVAAVASAIGARIPTWPGDVWIRLVGIGLFAALASLLCLWIACGARRWSYRLIGGAAGVVCLLAAYYVGWFVSYLGDARYGSPEWQRKFEAYFEISYFKTWLAWALPTILVGGALMTSLLVLARVSGWFSSSDQPATQSAVHVVLVRASLIFFAACITTPLLLILYILVNPPEPPAIDSPNPNGYEDLIAAGEMVPDDMLRVLRQRSSMTVAEQTAFMEKLQPAFARIAEGLQKKCRVARPYADRHSPEYENDVNAGFNAYAALIVRMLHSEQFGTNAEYRGACLELMRFSEEITRGGGIDIYNYFGPSIVAARLLDVAAELNASECRALVQELELFSQSREPHAAKVAVQKIVDQRSGWQPHLTYLRSEWSGRDNYPPPGGYWELRPEADFRLVLTAIAAQAFLLDNGHPPDSLTELTPNYLAKVPLDPFGSGPLRYRRRGGKFTVYSVGWDGDDDGGVEENLHNAGGGDTVISGPLRVRLHTQAVRAVQSFFDDYVAPQLQPAAAPAE